MNHSRAFFTWRHASILLGLFLLANFAASPAPAAIDLNHDGLGDIWQLKYGANGLPAQGDADSDGMTNAQEAAAGTDPFSAASKFRIKSLTADSAGFHVVWTSESGKRYQVQSAPGLGNPNWQNEGTPVNGTGGDLTYTTGTAAAAGRFFRVAVQDVFSTGDGVSDWEKIQLGFDPSSSHNHGPTGPDDLTWITSALGATNVVTLNAIDPVAYAPEATPGRILISRSGNLNRINVYYTVSGTAIPGIDYFALSGTVTLPFGVNSATIGIVPLSGIPPPAIQTVNLTLAASPSYITATPSTASVLISDQPLLSQLVGTITVTHTNGTISTYNQSGDTDTARGDALWTAWQNFAEGESMQIGPGTYLVSHILFGLPHQTVRGAGMYLTTVALGDLNGVTPTFFSRDGAVSSVFAYGLATTATYPWLHFVQNDGVTLSDMTIDCGLDRQTPAKWKAQAVGISGNDAAMERLRFINWGVRGYPLDDIVASEAFIAGIGCSGYWQQSCHNALIQDSIAEQPGNVIQSGGSSLFAIGGGSLSRGYTKLPPVPVAILTSSSASATTTRIITSGAHGINLTRDLDGKTGNFNVVVSGMTNNALNNTWTLAESSSGSAVHWSSGTFGSGTNYNTSSSPGGGYGIVESGTSFILPIAPSSSGVTGSNGQVFFEAGWAFNAKIVNCTVQNMGDSLPNGTSNQPLFAHASGIFFTDGAEVGGCQALNLKTCIQGSGYYQDTGITRNLWIHNNRFTNCNDPILVQTAPNDFTNYQATIENNTIQITPGAQHHAVYIELNSATNSSIVLKNNYILGDGDSGFVGTGIELINQENAVVQDNILDNCGNPAIYTPGVANLTRGNNRTPAGVLLPGEPGSGASNFIDPILNSAAFLKLRGLTINLSQTMRQLSKQATRATGALTSTATGSPSK